MDEHPFAPYVRPLGRGKRSRRDLSREQAGEAMSMILDGQAQPAQIGAFLMLLRVKEETPEELAGFLDACRRRCEQSFQDFPAVDVDWPSYAGKKKHPPWYLLAARLLADNDVRILMHGGPAHTPNRHYSDQMLGALGVDLPDTLDTAAAQLDAEGLTYLDVDRFCMPLGDLLMLRFQLGLRSPINTLVRCLNPAGATLSLQSVFHPAYLQLHLGAARLLDDQHLLLLKGEGGELEIRPDARTTLAGLRHGEPVNAVLDAALPRQPSPNSVSIDPLLSLWRGDSDDPYGRNAVIGTVAAILWGLERVDSLQQGHHAASALWEARERTRL
jgi:anthranilate phosphoribosyltransferase